MKTSNKEKIDEYFSDIRTASVFQALRSQKYTGIKRNEISFLLEKYSLNQVFNYLKTRYRKINYFLIYSVSFLIFLTIFIGIFSYNYFYMNTHLIFKYLSIKNYDDLVISDYINFLLAIALIINLILICKEAYNKFRKI
jgi:hypothetical protein